MDDTPTPQIYLVTPAEFDLSGFSDRLAAVLDAEPVACLRLSMASRDESRIARAADALREVCHARDVAIVIETHQLLVERLGLDGVHLTDGARSVRAARKALGDEAIVGAYCGITRHEGMSAGEAGADYVSFGPVGAGTLGDGRSVEREVFEWWSEVIELPVVAEGGLDEALIRDFAPYTDFFALGDEIWGQDDPVAALRAAAAAMRG